MSRNLGYIYIRQSRHKNYERTVSPEVQEQECRDLPEMRSCNEVVVYKDLDLSGGSAKRRKGWLALRERLEAVRKDDQVVLALYDQSRSFRNTAEALELYALLEQRPWIDVVFVHGKFDRSPIGEFSYTTLAAAHAMQRRMDAIKIREAKRYAAAQGDAVGPLPAGYKWSGNGVDRYVEIDETTAPLVRRVFAEYATGKYSARLLAHRLNAEGEILPANTGPREYRGKGWHGDTIMQLLGNVAYIGKTYSGSRRFRDGELIDAKWPALIDGETWESVQKQRATWRRGVGGSDKRDPRAYTFQGLLRCVCGRRMTVHRNRGRIYYRCRGGDAPDRCTARMIPEATLLPWAVAVMGWLDSNAPARFKEKAEELAGQRGDDAPTALANVEDSLRRADFMFYTAKRWTEDQYLAESSRLQAIRDELARAVAPSRPPLDFTGILSAWDGGDALTRRQLLKSVFEALDVEDGEIVAYVPRSDRAAEVAALLESGWQPRSERDSNPRGTLTAPTAFPVRRPRPTRRSLRHGLYPGLSERSGKRRYTRSPERCPSGLRCRSRKAVW